MLTSNAACKRSCVCVSWHVCLAIYVSLSFSFPLNSIHFNFLFVYTSSIGGEIIILFLCILINFLFFFFLISCLFFFAQCSSVYFILSLSLSVSLYLRQSPFLLFLPARHSLCMVYESCVSVSQIATKRPNNSER